MQDDVRSVLGAMEFLQGLPGPELDRLAVRCRVEQYHRGQIVAAAQEDVLMVLVGRVHVSQLSETGREIVLYALGPGGTQGLSQINPLVHLRVVVRATTAARICHMPSEVLRELALSSPLLAMHIVDELGARVALLTDLAGELAFSSLRVRLAHALARIAQSESTNLVVHTHEELAAIVGGTREEVTRSLAELRRLGLIRTEPYRRGIAIVDRVALARYSP